LSEEFAVVLPEKRALWGDGFEPLAMQMVGKLTSELVEVVEVGIVLVVAVGRPDETTARNRLRTRLTVLR